MRDDFPEDEDEDAADDAPSTSALEEEDLEEDDDNDIGISIAGLYNVSNTCYLNATVQVCFL